MKKINFLIFGSMLSVIPFSVLATTVSCSSNSDDEVKDVKPEQETNPEIENVKAEVERLNNFKFEPKVLAISEEQLQKITKENILETTNFDKKPDFDYQINLFTNEGDGNFKVTINVGIGNIIFITNEISIKFNVLPLAIYNPFPSLEKIVSPEDFYKLQQGAIKQASLIDTISMFGKSTVTIEFSVFGGEVRRKVTINTEKGTILQEEKINIDLLQYKFEKQKDYEFMTYVEIMPNEGQVIEFELPHGQTTKKAISGQDNITIISFNNLTNFIYTHFKNPFSLYGNK